LQVRVVYVPICLDADFLEPHFEDDGGNKQNLCEARWESTADNPDHRFVGEKQYGPGGLHLKSQPLVTDS